MGTERACRLLHSILCFALNPLFPTNDKPQIFPYYFITESNIKDTRKKGNDHSVGNAELFISMITSVIAGTKEN